MKKITFNTLPEAISELIDRVEKIEKILSKRTSQLKARSVPDKRRKARSQETPAGLLSVKEAGKFLKMSLVNLYSYVKNKKVPFEKRGRRLYFSKTALENWNKSRNQKNGSGDNITIKDAEKLLKVPASTIYYKIKSQKLKPAVKRGNKLLFSKRELINAFSKPSKRGRKASKSVKPLKPAKQAKPLAEKGEKPAKTAKAKSAPKVTKVSKKAKPAKQAKLVTKPAAKSVAKPAAKPAKKAAKPAKQAKPGKKSKPSRPAKAPVPKPEVTPGPEAGPQTENVPPTPATQPDNGPKE